MEKNNIEVPSYRARVERLFRRWDPRGLLYSQEKCAAAVARLKAPVALAADTASSSSGSSKGSSSRSSSSLSVQQRLALSEQAERDRARRICDAAVHPVLEQPIPSAFRVCSLLPITSLLSLAMISTKSAAATVLYHVVYQTHSAATRYCNYADTTRDLDASRMQLAYATSTAAACTIAVGASRLLTRLPSLKLVGLVVPHTAVACAGAVSTVLNAEVELREGVPVRNSSGEDLGLSVSAAKQTIRQAVLLHGVLVPACALLLPVAAVRTLVAPRLLKRSPHLLWPAASAVVVGCGFFATPVVSAIVPPVVELDPRSLEPELLLRGAGGRGEGGEQGALYSARELY
jgi:hypothetical protein